ANDDGATDDRMEIAEDSAAVLIDVLANDDAFGADGPAAVGSVVISSQAGKGVAVWDAVEGQVSYTPNQGAEGNDQFSYTITDADGDQSTATVYLDIAADSVPTVSVVDSQVDEEGLADGSNPNPALLTTSGDFGIATGNDTLQSLVIDGVDVTAADNVTGIDVVGDYGTLNVTFDGSTYRWAYTLADNTLDHPTNPGDSTAEGIFDDFNVVVTVSSTTSTWW
ncbi:hypothetical protein DWB85_00005, partial [Seongchinamella sediminis]